MSQATVCPGDRLDYPLTAGRGAYLNASTGAATANGLSLAAGDGLAVEDEPALTVVSAVRSV